MVMEKAAMGNLPEEVIAEILSWSPLKSLARLSCLSKSWNALITQNPHFSALRFNRAPQNPNLNTHKLLITTPSKLLSCDLNSSSINTLDFPLKRPDCRVQIVGSCNGLVCIVVDTLNDLVLWNPSTGLCRELPEPPHLRYIMSPLTNYAYGFGYDELSDDYKVVIAVPKPCSFVWIFSLKANSWRKKSLFNSYDSYYDTMRFDGAACSHDTKRRGVLVNGVLYWWGPYKIYGFDLGKENCYRVQLPCESSIGILNLFYLATQFLPTYYEEYNLAQVDKGPLVFKHLNVDEDAACLQLVTPNGGGNFNWEKLPLCIGKGGEIIFVTRHQPGCGLIVYDENLISPYDWIKR